MSSTSQDSWNPSQYERFRAERSQPFFDLMALVQPEPGMRVIDLGCGTGELTQQLHRHLLAVETLGLDSSEAMLEKTAAFAGDGLRFVSGEIATFANPGGTVSGSAASGNAAPAEGRPPVTGNTDTDGAFDLIFTNAALQWLQDHESLFAGLAARLAARGQLAVQVPANEDHLSHVVAREIAAEAPFQAALEGHVRRFGTLRPELYSALLHRLGFSQQHVRLQVYGHLLPGRADVVEWVKGTLLTDYQKRLSEEIYAQFLERYWERLLPRLEDSHPYFYPFKRVLLWARK